MTRKSKMDVKAGNNPQENNPMFKKAINKTASMLLVAIMGLSTMSFVQDESFAVGSDTNQSTIAKRNIDVAKEEKTALNCCVTKTANPGDELKNAFYISTPGKKAIYKADKETIVTFIKESKSRRVWSMDIKAAREKADAEMNRNFLLGKMYPSVVTAAVVDQQIISSFLDDAVLQSAALTKKYSAEADQEVADQFVSANLSVTMTRPSVQLVADADAAIEAAFDKANRPYISLPSQIAVQTADQEMLHRHQVENTLTALK
ncbi:MAG TPA: hypothetical protein VFV68_08450 [Agriterribacter sp.]|nr:hypothetical protein [Agriterribacter sp.]